MTPPLALLLACAPLAWGGSGLSLEEALGIAKLEHPSIQAARETVHVQAEALRQTQAVYYPQLNYSASLTRRESHDLGDDSVNPAGTFARADELTPLNLAARQRVYDFGRTPGRVGTVRWSLRSAQADLRAKEESVFLEVREAYFNALRTEESLRVIAASEAERSRFLRLTRDLYQAGRRAQFDVAKAEADAKSARLDRMIAASRLETAHKRLLVAMGIPNAAWRPLTEPLQASPARRSESDLVALALQRRPEVEAQRAKAASAGKAAAAAKADLLPTIDLAGGYYWQSVRSAASSNLGADAVVWNRFRVWSAGATLSWDIFSGFGSHAALQAARARSESLRQEARAIEQSVTFEVQAALIALQDTQTRIETSLDLLRSARESLRLAIRRFEGGSGSSVEVSDARREALRDELAYIDTLADYRIAQARLDRAAGTTLAR